MHGCAYGIGVDASHPKKSRAFYRAAKVSIKGGNAQKGQQHEPEFILHRSIYIATVNDAREKSPEIW
jgi:hypothetical protein